MRSAKRTLFLHVGQPKTGSSFVQAVFAQNVDLLRSQGIDYPTSYAHHAKAVEGGISSGNGIILEKILDSGDDNALAAISSVVANLLFSRERLIWLFSTENNLDRIVALAAKRFDMINFLVFARNPIEHAVSSYIQHVKRSSMTISVDEYLSNHYNVSHTVNFLRNLMRFSSKIKGIEVAFSIRNYSVVRNALLDSVCDWLEIDQGAREVLSKQALNADVNRSLTAGEVALQIGVNRVCPDSAQAFSDKLMETVNQVHSDPVWPSLDAQRVLLDRIAGEIEFINGFLDYDERLVTEVRCADWPQYSKENVFWASQLESIGEIIGEFLGIITTLKKENKDLKAAMHFQRAIHLRSQGKYEEAYLALERVVRLNPLHTSAKKLLECRRKD